MSGTSQYDYDEKECFPLLRKRAGHYVGFMTWCFMGLFVMLVGNEMKVILRSVLGAVAYAFNPCMCDVGAKIGRSQ